MLNLYVYKILFYSNSFNITSQRYEINDFLQIISSIFYQPVYVILTNIYHVSDPSTYTAIFDH